jgi:hypothetical protein
MSIPRSLVIVLLVAAVATPAGQSGGPVRARSQQPVVVEVRDDGFHWLDAGLGAAAGAAATLVVLGLVLTARHGRPIGRERRSQ